MMKYNEIIYGDNVEVLKTFPNNCIDLTVTSPPYDNLRDYNGYSFDFENIAKELFRVTKPGGVLVWIVGDATVNGSETGTSFKQVLYFKSCMFNLHDTMVYLKNTFAFPSSNRYHQVFEYMFILSKGVPKTFNPIKDRENIYGLPWGKATKRQKDGTLKEVQLKDSYEKYGMRHNVWKYNTGAGHSYPKGSLQKEHPASFPIKLAEDHVKSWSNEEDIVLDPFCGSGTTCVVAKQLNRKYIGIDISDIYCDLSRKRLETEV